MMTKQETLVLTVYFDGRCGLCSKEIAHYQAIAPAAKFRWCEIQDALAELETLGLSEAQALKQLYSQDSAGELFYGVDTFIQIWRRLPRWHWLAKFTQLPLIYSLAKILYAGFAKWRFKRLTHCQLAASKQVS